MLSAFRVKSLPTKKHLKRFVSTALKTLKNRQNKDGGFGFWNMHSNVNSFVTGHVGLAISLAREKGYTMPGFFGSWLTKYATISLLLLELTEFRLEKYLEKIESGTREFYWEQHHSAGQLATIAFSIYVRYRLSPSNKIKTVAENFYSKNQPDILPLEALGWILSVLGDTRMGLSRSRYADEIARYLNDHVQIHDTTGTVTVQLVTQLFFSLQFKKGTASTTATMKR